MSLKENIKREKIAYDKKIAEFVVEIEKKSKEIQNGIERVSSLDKAILEKEEEFRIKTKELQDRIDSLNSSISQTTEEYLILFKSIPERLQEISDNFSKQNETLDERNKELEKKNSEIDKKVVKVGADLRTIELYAKRLQAYYDDTGVKLNILPTFNIKKDK